MELLRFLRKKGLEKRAEKKSKKDGLLESGLFENYKSEDFREYLPSLAMRILKELCEISPYICEDSKKKKENYQAILKYLKEMHDPESYASPQALRRALGASTSTRLVEKMDDILAAEAAKMREALPKDSLDALKRTLEADKKFNLRKKLLRFLDSKDLGMKALLDGVGYTEKELEKLIKNSSDLDDIEQKKKASEALRSLVNTKSRILMQAEKAYERFIKTGALPEEKDFRCAHNKNVFYKLSFVEDRIISRIMAFASDRMSQYVKVTKKAKRKKDVSSQAPGAAQEKAQVRKEVGERQNIENSEIAKQILFNELRKENSERKYLPKNAWPTGKNTGPIYKDSIEAYFEYFKNKEKFDEKELAQVIKDYCIELAENSKLKEQTIKTIIKQVERAYKNIFKDIGAKSGMQDRQSGKKESKRESTKVRKSGWMKGFMIAGASALALTALTFAGYKGYVSFSGRAKVESTHPESEKSKNGNQILKETQCKAKIKEINALLDSLHAKLQKQMLLDRTKLRKLQGEVSQLKEDLRENEELARRVREDLDELNQKLKSILALLNKRGLEKAAPAKTQVDSHKEQVFDVPDKLRDFLNKKLGIKSKLKEKGFSDEKVEKVYLLFAKGISALFKDGKLYPLNYGFQSYRLEMPWLFYKDDLRQILYFKFSDGKWAYDILFSEQAADDFDIPLNRKDLKVAKEVFKEALS